MACIFSHLSLITLFTFLVSSCSAGWVLKDNYTPDNFFSKFSFWTGPDPTHGHVNYVDQGTATANGLVKQRNGGVYMGVDSTNQAPNGRMSVRLTSYAKYNVGSLMILDLKHMPVGCGTWPAYWTVGPNWPAGGEIDIVEGVHNQVSNAMTLHTNDGCSINQNNPLMTGSVATSNCYIKAPGQWDNQGCSIGTGQTNTYGKGLNKAGGGVYAMAWQAKQIRVWFFPRGSIPGDIASGKPTPASWGKPLSIFSGSCNIPQFFKDHQIVFDTTFCGDWAGNVWEQSGCKSDQYPTCQSYVTNNPAAFKNAYWQINYLKVFTMQNNPVSSSPVPSTRAAATTPAAVATPIISADVPGSTGTNDDPQGSSGSDNQSQGQGASGSASGGASASAGSSSSMNVIVGKDGKLILSPGKRDVPAPETTSTDASASDAAPEQPGILVESAVALENLVPQMPVLRRPSSSSVEKREEPVSEDAEGGDEDEDAELLAVLARERARKGRHGAAAHKRRHIRNVGLRDGVHLH
ncbi:Endo-1,3(4)-beta-glucanase-like protein 2 [Elsinoe fawcettii]|nr:Endo-1,3(4)-beta-glucanase-like protein 2 [Elsinoe fawcettii]